MKRIILILAILAFGFTAFAQTYSTLPAGSKPYGNQMYIIPSSGLVIGGNSGYGFRVLGTKQYVDSLLALKANDANVVHKTGNETIAGIKTFTGMVAINDTSNPVLTLQNSAGLYSLSQNGDNVFRINGNNGLELLTITQNGNISIRNTPGTQPSPTQILTRDTVTGQIKYTTIGDISTGVGGDFVHKTGNLSETITGAKTFSTDVQIPAIPTNSTSAASKSYIDNLITGITWKAAVKAATIANITLSGAQTIDGFSAIAGDRILVKNQTAQADNGIYLVASGSWTRTTDADTGAEIETATVAVTSGTANGDTQWTCTATNITLGITAITFGQISGAGTYSASTGLTLTGNVFAIDGTVATLAGVQSLSNKTLVAPALGTPVSGIATNLTGLPLSTGVTGVLPIANGGTSATTAPLARTALGGSTIGQSVFTLTNPSAVTFPRYNADNTVSALDAATFRTAIGAGSGSGTVTNVTGSGNIASSGGTTPNITFTGILPVANGGTGSGTQNYVDLTTNQTIGGVKTFTSTLNLGGSKLRSVPSSLVSGYDLILGLETTPLGAARIAISDTISLNNNGYHGFGEYSDIKMNGTASAYATFDAKNNIFSTTNNDHNTGFQSRNVYKGTGVVNNYMSGFHAINEHAGTGTITSYSGVRINDILKSSTGTITTDYGLKIENIQNGTANNYAIHTNGGKQLFFGETTQISNLGIGVSPNISWVDFKVTEFPNGGYIGSYSPASNLFSGLNSYFNGSAWKYKAAGAATRYQQGGAFGTHSFSRAISGAAGATITWITDIYLDENGRLGINNTSPTEKLHVIGNSIISGTGTFGGAVIAGAPIRLKGYTVATLPAGVQGDSAFVTDALAPTFMATVVGGGSVVTRVFYNGTAWTSQ